MNPTNCPSRAVPRQTDQTVTHKMGFDACKQLVPPGYSVGAAFPSRTLLSDQLRSKSDAALCWHALTLRKRPTACRHRSPFCASRFWPVRRGTARDGAVRWIHRHFLPYRSSMYPFTPAVEIGWRLDPACWMLGPLLSGHSSGSFTPRLRRNLLSWVVSPSFDSFFPSAGHAFQQSKSGFRK